MSRVKQANTRPGASKKSQKQERKPDATKTTRRVWAIASNTIFALCLLILVGAAGLSVLAKNKNTPVTVAGYQPYIIATASMEPTFAVDGLVITHADNFEEVNVGDVVAFRAEGLAGKTALHRVIAKNGIGDLAQLIVKGDNNPHPDGAAVTKKNYVGRVVFNTNVTAMFFGALRKPGGLFLAIVLPVIILALIYFGGRWIIGSTNDWRSKGLAVCLVITCIAGSLFASYLLSTIKQVDATNSNLADVSHNFVDSDDGKTWSVNGNKVLGTIEIPKINLIYPIIPYISATSLNISITHFYGAGLNQPGNDVLAGHRVYGQRSPFHLFFTSIDKLHFGDTIYITDLSRTKLAYHVTGYKTVAPDDASVLTQPSDGKKHLTLISCSFDLRNRYIVTAVAESTVLPPE